MDRPFVILLGGRHKGEPYTRLGPLLAARCRQVIAFGEAGCSCRGISRRRTSSDARDFAEWSAGPTPPRGPATLSLVAGLFEL